MPSDFLANSARAAARSRERVCKTTSWPSSMRARAAAKPSPSVLPVMKTRLIYTLSRHSVPNICQSHQVLINPVTVDFGTGRQVFVLHTQSGLERFMGAPLD